MKTFLIVGGSGSWGQELTKQLLKDKGTKQIRIYSRGEHKQVEMKRKISDSRVEYILGDIRDKARLTQVGYGVETIFSLAALKHVPVCEDNPWEAVQTNVCGTQNVIDSALTNKVEKVIYVSSDKAVDPINIYGVTKSCAEKLIIAANCLPGKTIFSCIRSGNVLGTNGSVIPLFMYQIIKFNEVTITDKQMSRYIVRLPKVVNFLINSSKIAKGGEIFVMKMPAVKIIDLANTIIKKIGNGKTIIRFVGIRPGEKIYETLVSRYELERSYDMGEYFVIFPLSNKKHKKTKRTNNIQEYNSQNSEQLNQKDMMTLLTSEGLMNKNDSNLESNLAYVWSKS